MKNKGFTLVELIGVLVILGIVMALSFPVLLSSMNKTEKKISDSTKKIIESASKDYIDKNYLLADNKYTYCVKLDDMVEGDYVSENQISDLDLKDYVKIEFDDSNKVKSSVVSTCNEVKITDGGYNTYSYNSVINFNPYNSKKCTAGTENCLKWIVIDREDDKNKNAIDVISLDCLYNTKVSLLKNTFLRYNMDNVWNSSLNPRLIGYDELTKIAGTKINADTVSATVTDATILDGSSCVKDYIATNTEAKDKNSLFVLYHTTKGGTNKLVPFAYDDNSEADVKLIITIPKNLLN